MGLWSYISNTVSDTVDTITDAIDDGAEALGEGISDLFDSAGSALETIFTKMHMGWLGRVINATLVFVTVLIKSTIGIIASIITGAVKIIGGLVTLNWDLIMNGLEDVFASIAGAVIMIALQAIALAQTILLLQKDRPLTPEEVVMVKRVFESSLTVYIMRIVEGDAGLFSVNDRPFTLGNTIYMKHYHTNTSPDTFIHECVHVWQYHHIGIKYISQAAFSQLYYDNAYGWIDFYFNHGITNWKDFNKESQGRFIQDVYVSGETICGMSTPIVGNGTFLILWDKNVSIGL